jgi:hypothetical protein
MKNQFLSFLFLLIGISLVAQEEKIVTVKGIAPSYIGQSVSISGIQDYFSMKETPLATTTVKEDSTFSVSFFVKETQKVIVRANKNKSYLYVQPKGVYDIYVPDKDKYEPYRPGGNEVEITFFDLDSTDINYQILQFQRWSDEFLGNYFYIRKSKPLEFAKKMDEFKAAVITRYQLDDTLTPIVKGSSTNYLKVFVRFTMASYDNIQYAAERNRYEKHDFYIKHSPVEYSNDAYMGYISTFYEKMSPRLSMETNNRVYLGLLKSSPTLIMHALGTEYTLINMRIREMVMIKLLSEEFYSKDFPQTNILTVLDSVSKHSLFEANAIIAGNMKDRLTELSVGGKAPEFVLKNGKNESRMLNNYSKKHLYLHFYDPSGPKSQIELDPLINIYKNYKEDVQFITIYPPGSYDSITKTNYLNNIPWEKFEIEKSNPIWKNYKIETYPSYVLIDGYGYIVMSPALGPMPNGQYETIDKTFYYIQRVNKELREGN